MSVVLGVRLYRVPFNECWRVTVWIIFSLYYLFLPGTCIAYLMNILVTSYVRMHESACMCMVQARYHKTQPSH